MSAGALPCSFPQALRFHLHLASRSCTHYLFLDIPSLTQRSFKQMASKPSLPSDRNPPPFPSIFRNAIIHHAAPTLPPSVGPTIMVMRLRGFLSRQRCMTSMSAAFWMGGNAILWLASMMACIFWMKGRWLQGAQGVHVRQWGRVGSMREHLPECVCCWGSQGEGGGRLWSVGVWAGRAASGSD